MPALILDNISKTFWTGVYGFQKQKKIIENINLKVFENEVFGLIGLNGAGKTTTIKIILGLLKPTTGHCTILNGSVENRQIRNQIGYLPEAPYFSRQHSGRELLNFFGSLYELTGKKLRNRVDEILDVVQMRHAASEKIFTYSKGMLQRIGIGQALIAHPKLLICDEPMSGLDPVGYKEMRDIFLELKHRGTTVFLNTHDLNEVERICDRIGIIYKGRLLKTEEMSHVLGSTHLLKYWIELDQMDFEQIQNWPVPWIKNQDGIQIEGDQLPEALNRLASQKIYPKSIRPLSSTLEAFFLKAIQDFNEAKDHEKHF